MAKKNIYNNFVTEEKLKKVQKQNMLMIEDFIIDCKSRKLKSKTIEQYNYDLNIFAVYILENMKNKSFINVKKKELKLFILECMENFEWSTARVNRVLSSIRGLYNFVWDEDDYEDDVDGLRNPADKLKGVTKEKRRDIIFITDEDIEILYNHLVEKEEYQLACFLAVAYDCGGRKNELVQIRKDSVGAEFTNEVIGKRGKKFRLLLLSRSRVAIDKWLEVRGEDNISSLFISGKTQSKRKEATTEVLYHWAKKLGKIAYSLTDKEEYLDINVHTFRHCTAQNIFDKSFYYMRETGKEFDLNQIRLLLHHESADTTLSYTNAKAMEEEMLVEAFFG